MARISFRRVMALLFGRVLAVSASLDDPAASFGHALRQRANATWGASFVHPFVLSLANGSLPRETFRFYLMQDAKYLQAYADVASVIATRVKSFDEKMWFQKAALLALQVEQQLHEGYGKALGFGPADVEAVEPTPYAQGYADSMLRAALTGSVVEAMGALLPCPWLYAELGAHLARTYFFRSSDHDDAAACSSFGGPSDTQGVQAVNIVLDARNASQAPAAADYHVPADHPYRGWLLTYAGDGLAVYTSEFLAILQGHAVAAGWGPGLDLDALHTTHPLRRAAGAFATSVRYEWMFWEQAWTRQAWPLGRAG